MMKRDKEPGWGTVNCRGRLDRTRRRQEWRSVAGVWASLLQSQEQRAVIVPPASTSKVMLEQGKCECFVPAMQD